MSRNRYGQWQDGPDPLAPPYDVRAAVDAVGRDVLRGTNLREALRNLLRRGPAGRGGLDDALARARRQRREAMRRGRLDGAVLRAQQLLDQALAAERAELSRRDDDAARFAEATLNNLPRSTARAVEELAGYDWTSAEAQELYQRILDGLRHEVIEQRFRGLSQALSDPAAQQSMAEMLRDLNALLERHARGEDTTDQFAEFMRRHGDYFPERPGSTDELIDALAQRAAAGERLMRSLSPAQQEELSRLMAQAFGDGALGRELAALTDNLRALRPDLPWTRRERVQGDSPLGYGEATGALEEIAELDDLIDQLAQEHPGATLDDIDVEAVSRSLGRSTADDVRRLQELERELRRQGWLSRGTAGPTLSPKALRRLGNTALRTVFVDLDGGRRGQHDVRSTGAAGEVTGSSRPWAYGDEQPLDVVRTVARAVLRAGPSVPVALTVADFEVVDTEQRASAAVALCVDLSFSMVLNDCWGAMKQTALALSHLVATRYPQDALQIIGFGLDAERMSQSELAAADPDREKGTNLQHALCLAQRHLRRHSESEPVVLVVTDGEPTAHNGPYGPEFWWPPTRETVEATLSEVDQLTRYGATINVFMLGEDGGLRRFVDAVARRSGGRVFTPAAEDLGRYVVADYVRSRRGRRARR